MKPKKILSLLVSVLCAVLEELFVIVIGSL